MILISGVFHCLIRFHHNADKFSLSDQRTIGLLIRAEFLESPSCRLHYIFDIDFFCFYAKLIIYSVPKQQIYIYAFKNNNQDTFPHLLIIAWLVQTYLTQHVHRHVLKTLLKLNNLTLHDICIKHTQNMSIKGLSIPPFL